MKVVVETRLTKPEEAKKWDKWARKKLVVSSGALLISVVLLALAFSGVGVPASSSPGDWFQRSGAAVTVFCVYNQQVLSSIPKALLPVGPFANLSKFAVWQKYMPGMPWLEGLNLGIMLFATIVWGYGDIMRRSIMSLVAP
ncbi:hypothetical protein ACMHYO_16335 [Allopusillimonas ginsengisoli]|uniref:hypothetical protein n=1 Tax=Allopusillimonas ginsengisoli TaxID=453575 RepID=UPI0039C20267